MEKYVADPADLALVTGFGSYSEPRFRHYSRGLFWIRWISPKLGLSYSPCEDSIGLTPKELGPRAFSNKL